MARRVKRGVKGRGAAKGLNHRGGIHTVKRRGRTEPFDEKKIYASAYAASLNAHLNVKEAESIAEKVLAEVKKALAVQKIAKVSSSHLSILVHDALEKHNKDAAFLYETHLDLS